MLTHQDSPISSGFLWLGETSALIDVGNEEINAMIYARVVAIVPGTISFITTLAPRYLSTRNNIKRAKLAFDTNANTQREFVDALKHIDVDYLKEIDNKFKSILATQFNSHDTKQPLSNQENEKLMQELAIYLSKLSKAHPDLINQKTTSEYVIKYAQLIFDFSFALIAIAPPSFLTQMQKGYDGINLLTGSSLSDINAYAKRGLGTASGLANAIFYSGSTLDFSTTITNLAKYLYNHPKQIPGALLLLVANYFSSGGMQNVAEGVINKPNNIIGVPSEDPYQSTYVYLMQIGGFVVRVKLSRKN